jgi:hypothetical protein
MLDAQVSWSLFRMGLRPSFLRSKLIASTIFCPSLSGIASIGSAGILGGGASGGGHWGPDSATAQSSVKNRHINMVSILINSS